MKRFAKLFLSLVVLSLLVACGGKKEVEQHREIVGEYNFQATGSLDFSVGSTPLFSMPLDESGTFMIEQATEPNEVLLIGYNDTIRATVAGDYLLLESTTEQIENGELSMQLTFVYGKAKFENDHLTWHTDIIGTAIYGAFSASGTGEIDMVATKK